MVVGVLNPTVYPLSQVKFPLRNKEVCEKKRQLYSSSRSTEPVSKIFLLASLVKRKYPARACRLFGKKHPVSLDALLIFSCPAKRVNGSNKRRKVFFITKLIGVFICIVIILVVCVQIFLWYRSFLSSFPLLWYYFERENKDGYGQVGIASAWKFGME